MYKKVIKYEDYNGVAHEEEFLFNMTEAEITEMNLGVKGGMGAIMQQIANTRDIPKLIEIFKNIILKAYGEKSPDGRKFVKSQELRDAFEQCPAYSELFMELVQDNKAASDFLIGIMPKKVREAGENGIQEAQAEVEKIVSGPQPASMLG